MRLRLDLEGHGLSPARFPKVMMFKEGTSIEKTLKKKQMSPSKKGSPGQSESDEIQIPDHFDGKPKDEISQHGFDIKSPAIISKSKRTLNDLNKSMQQSLD